MAVTTETTPSRIRHIAAAVLVAAVATLALPDIALDSGFADAVVRLTDTGTWPLMAPFTVIVALILTLRPEPRPSHRTREAVAVVLILPIALAGNALLNEHVVKPAFGAPRPNIGTLAEDGVLGPDIPDADSFYAMGNKQARRDLLHGRLTAATTPHLSPKVRAHWIHETGYSFPSGHATASVTFAILMAAAGLRWWAGWRRLIAIYALPAWAVAVVWSRPLLGVHTPIDVIAGTITGFLWGIASFTVVRRIVER